MKKRLVALLMVVTLILTSVVGIAFEAQRAVVADVKYKNTDDGASLSIRYTDETGKKFVEVYSLKEAKEGDIICYYGHVAIYLGDGRIVHASNSRDGIKISERADYRTIAGIRRIFD